MANEIVLNSFTVEEEFGTPPTGRLYSRLTLNSFTAEEEFTTPPNGSLYSKITLNPFTEGETFGTADLKAKITINSFVENEEFQTPPNGSVYSRITLASFVEDEEFNTPPNGELVPGLYTQSIVENAVFGQPILYSKIILNSFTEEEVFGSPPASFNVSRTLVAGGFEVNVAFGRARIYQPDAAPVAPPGVNRTILAPFAAGELGSSGLGKVYKDYTHHMKPHPITADVTRVFDANAVSGSLKNIALTNTGERPFSSSGVAGNINKMLFENASPEIEGQVQSLLFNAFASYEPRAVVIDINIEMSPDQNSAEITVYWKMKGYDQEYEFTVFLERA